MDQAEFYSVKLTQDVSGGYGRKSAGSKLENLSKAQADALHQAGHAEAPVAQKAAVPVKAAAETPAK